MLKDGSIDEVLGLWSLAGVDYHFAGIDDVRAEIAQGRFVEHAEVHGNIYGTSKVRIVLGQQPAVVPGLVPVPVPRQAAHHCSFQPPALATMIGAEGGRRCAAKEALVPSGH